MPELLDEEYSADTGTDGDLHAGAVPSIAWGKGPAPLGRHLRHDAGFRLDHGLLARGSELLYGCGMGNLRFQGVANLGQVHGRVDRDRQSSSVDRGVLAAAFRDGTAAG